MPRILVADDNANIQRMVSLLFEKRGISVVSVANGEAAVKRIPDFKPDLILADVFMPARSGYEVCEFVKKDVRYAQVPVILLVGAFDPLDEKEARRVGADGILKKPFVPQDPLIDMVMSALEKIPRVAAELAKAREAAAPPPPPPPPVAALEYPAMKEPVPLPEFPEPTPEEEAAMFGYGSNMRPRKEESKTSAEVNSQVLHAQGGKPEADASATASDWRHAEMDIEIPEDVAGQPTFSLEQDFGPITFPSERDVQPQHILIPEPEEKIEIGVPQTEPDDRVIINASCDSAEEPSTPLAATSEAEAGPVSVPMSLPPLEDEVQSKWAEMEAAVSGGSNATEAEPDVPSHIPHWMDSVSPNPSEYPSRSWLADAVKEEPAWTKAEVSNDLVIPEVTQESSNVFSQFEREIEFARAVVELPAAVHEEHDTQAAPSQQNGASSEPLALSNHENEEQEEHFGGAVPHASSQMEELEDFDERIPTMEPPNREALAGIPFLMPPPLRAPESVPLTETDSRAADAIVQKILERLEPQIRELLSQELLKPMIENLLHQELSKKEK